MSTAVRVALVALPLAAIFLLIRWIGGGEAERWRARVAGHVPGATVGVDRDGLIIIADDRGQADAAEAQVRGFRQALAARYTDLLGEPSFERMVVVVFPDVSSLQAYAGETSRVDRGATGDLLGYTDAAHGAVFVPADEIDVLRHETVHWFMETARDVAAPGYSPWLSEGLAQLFETLDPDAVPPEPPNIGHLRLDRGLDVARLIRIEDYGDFLTDGQRNYTEALALCAFLFETRRDQLREYIKQERRSSESRPEAFEEIFETNGEAFRKDLAAFIARLR